MKKISLLILVSVFVTIGFAQQFPLQSQYQFNYQTINPAASGENDFYRARASFREQWVGLTDNPISTQILTVTKGFGVNGLGITVFSDKTGGAFNKSGAAISYSHKVKFEGSNLYFGVSGGASKINLAAINDPALLSNDDVIPEFNFGMYYTFKELKIGVSIPGLLATNMELSGSADNTVDRHFYSMISYAKKLSDDWTAHPSILVKTTANHNQIDANINFKLKNKLWFGTSYRQEFGPTIYVGIDFGKLLSVYSFDISTNEVADYSNGSHELTFGYDFIPDAEAEKKRKEAEQEEDDLLKDKDKDGIADDDDLCPDVAGDEIANGCPDFDKDGIPDKFDLCPHLFGDANSQGCPELTTAEYLILTRALGDLKFDFDKDIINHESYRTLTDLTVLMHKNPSMYLLIEGHASAEGTASYNLSLSARRAKAVQNFFIGRGIGKSRLIIDFYGEETPLNNNTNEKERADNRRVEFDIKYHLYDEFSAENLQEEYDSLLNTINNKNVVEIVDYDEVVVQQPIIIEDTVVVTKEVVADTIVVAEEDTATIKAESTTVISKNPVDGMYLVIVQVFTDSSNAIDYTYSNDADLEYTSVNGKYYVFAFSSKVRAEAEQFRNAYGKGSWILDPK
jgi:type IX secretion system PorP/SprF family membrane protein